MNSIHVPRSFIADVALTHPDFPLGPTLKAIPTASITEESIRPATTADEPAVLYRVTDVDFRTFESALEHDDTVSEWA